MVTRDLSKSLDHVNWWEPEHWRTKLRSVSSVSLERADPANIRNGWLTLQDTKARFQQKQMQEREMKIASLYESQQARALDRVRHSPSSTATSPSQAPAPAPVQHHPGKVRQMFEERRTKGIDKSYPLQPIHNTERARKPLPNGYTKVTSTASKTTVEKRSVRTHNTHTVRKQQHKIENLVNGSSDLNHNHELDLNTSKHKLPKTNGAIVPSIDELDRADNNYLLENETFPEALEPTPTPRSPEPEPKKPPRRNPSMRNNTTATKPQPAPVAPPRRATSDNSVSESSKARGAMQRTINTVPKRQSASPTAGKSRSGAVSSSSVAPASGGSGGSGTPCAVCGRRFAPDRLAKHQEICRKAHAKKRKPFDALKHRLAGTEAEPFINKLRKTAPNASSNKVTTKPLNNNWRQKHEEFIQAIRAAKQVQAHLNAGGKLSDLPPPPPSENPDYVQCPHCNRRFNQAAAERHIPKCASYQFNKPKPNAKKR